ncbi:hypothetical protein E2F50_06445 [Rhizobium deserti]|uniref:Uncharacterized protein n=1 Tax=Rhizobium deserti TaxID=2547961 RepID=A0A4R5UIL8_9HYPH|nr:hypothetical protein [Rhizobium deserti]TDK36569.1 hypothetical protein E2F50_06445 [Rhizobium deserti]
MPAPEEETRKDFPAFCHGLLPAARLHPSERNMNDPFNAVSEGLWLNADIGGMRPRILNGATWDMLALLVIIAVLMALALDALLFLVDPEEA